MQTEEPSIAGAVLEAGGMLANLHLADSNRCALGEGSLDVDAILMALYLTGFNADDKFATPEPLGPGGNPYPAMYRQAGPGHAGSNGHANRPLFQGERRSGVEFKNDMKHKETAAGIHPGASQRGFFPAENFCAAPPAQRPPPQFFRPSFPRPPLGGTARLRRAAA